MVIDGHMGPVILAEGLTKRFNKVIALNEVSLKIDSGNCVGLLGPNGAGKSTFIKILCGLLRPTNGQAHVNGFNPYSDRKNALSDVGCIVEEPAFYTCLDPVTLLRYLGEFRGLSGQELEKRIKEVLEFTNLTKWSKTKIGKFSRGMRQKLSFAQAILHDPSILILDEPGLGLDPRSVYAMRQFIKSSKREGKTIFLASHMLHEVQETCNMVALINKGKLLVYKDVGALEKMFGPQTLEVEVLRKPSAAQIKKIKKLDIIESISIDGTSLKLKFSGDKADRADLLEALINEVGLAVTSFRTLQVTLEGIYLQLIGD